MKETQREKVKAHLQEYGSITPMEALRLFGCFRLAVIIHRLRTEDGLEIDTLTVDNEGGNAFARYTLKPKGLAPMQYRELGQARLGA